MVAVSKASAMRSSEKDQIRLHHGMMSRLARSLDEIHLHWAKDHRLLKHAIADDSFLDAGDGDSLLFPGRVYKKSPAIDNPCVNSLGCLGARLNTRNRVEIVHQRSDRGRIRFRRQIDRISFAELVDCDNRGMVCGIRESRNDRGRRLFKNFIVMYSGLNRVTTQLESQCRREVIERVCLQSKYIAQAAGQRRIEPLPARQLWRGFHTAANRGAAIDPRSVAIGSC